MWNYMDIAQDRDYWRDFVNVPFDLRILLATELINTDSKVILHTYDLFLLFHG